MNRASSDHPQGGKVGSFVKSKTLLRKASAWSRSLAGLEFWVGFADHIHRAFAFHDLAISVTALGGGKGRKNFHDGKMVDVFDCPRARRDAENRRRMTFVKQIPSNSRGFLASFL
jgi:hypothetical protein